MHANSWQRGSCSSTAARQPSRRLQLTARTCLKLAAAASTGHTRHRKPIQACAMAPAAPPEQLDGAMRAFLASLQARVVAAEQAAAAAAAAESGSHEAAAASTSACSDDEDGSGDADDEARMRQLVQSRAPGWGVVERSVSYTNGDTYAGGMLGEQRHGRGTHTTSKGDVYSGAWRYDRRDGAGRFRLADGTEYDGSWVDDRACGTGTCRYPNGSTYVGDWEADQRSGWGLLTTGDGQQYEGEWRNDKPHGQGRWLFADGASHYLGRYEAGQKTIGQLVLFEAGRQVFSYTGSFKAEQKHGQGAAVAEGAWEYQGSWRRDARSGSGTCRFPDGSRYEGSWKGDARYGGGTMVWSDGSRYEGEWQQDQPHGTGTFRWASGERYTGQWALGRRHGQGRWTGAPHLVPAAASSSSSSSGSSASASKQVEGRETYVGSWADDRRSGQGTCVFADGGRYQGSWRAGKRHGQGLMVFPDGVAFRGLWEEDEWIQSAAEPALCRLAGPGLAAAVAGRPGAFTIRAYDELNNPRLCGGDAFSVLLLPGRPATGPAARVGGAGGAGALLPAPPAAACAARGAATPAVAAADAQQRADAASSSEVAGLPLPLGPAETVVAVAVGEVQDSGDGTYSCSYSHTVAGLYELHVTNGGGEHVGDSPYPVSVRPGPPCPRASSVSGAGRSCAVAGAAAEFEVAFRDAHGNACCGSGHSDSGADGGEPLPCQMPVQAVLLGSNTLPAAAVSVASAPGSGAGCRCSYTAPSAPGLYVLEVTAGGRHLRGSPFSVKVVSPPAAASSGVSADSASSNGGASGRQQLPLELNRHRHWADVARSAYAAVDGRLDGFEDGEEARAAAGQAPAGLSRHEAEMVKDNPALPVVERLEDLWLLSTLQAERKAREEAAAAAVQRQQQAGKAQQRARAAVGDEAAAAADGHCAGAVVRMVTQPAASYSDGAGDAKAAPVASDASLLYLLD